MARTQAFITPTDEQFSEEFNPTMVTPVTTTVSPEIQAVVDGATTKSEKIRTLSALGVKRGEIAKLLGIRYQHVRNVLITPIKRTKLK